jgi:oxaloacetate decarboxylase gamma subunit
VTDSPIIQGLELMVAGMGTVFVFLSLLIVATTGMSALVRRFATAPAPIPEAAAVSEEEVAAITAAVARHRRSRGAGE